jgi:hypothetical protein
MRTAALCSTVLMGGAAAGPPGGFEAAWRAAAARFAAKIQPRMSAANKQQLQEGLAVIDPSPPLEADDSRVKSPHALACAHEACFFVSPLPSPHCSDTGPGSEGQPLCTVQAAATACRQLTAGAGCAVFLRGGTHRLRATVELAPEDSGLLVASYPGERAVVSGAQALDSSGWTKVRSPTGTTTLWRAPVADRPPAIDTLYTDGVRAIPARYPNADFELDKYPIGYVSGGGTAWAPPTDLGKPRYIQYNDSATFRPSYRKLFTDYRGGVGGQCSHYDPPFSYWCAETPQGGGAAQFEVPSALQCHPKTLPNAPYASLSGGRITAWRPGHWANWQFELAADATGQQYQPRPASACRLFVDSDATAGNDVPGGGSASSSAADCAAMCAADCDCEVGVWGKRNSTEHDCFLKSGKASVVSIGSKKGNVAFNCTPCVDPPVQRFNFTKGGFQGGRGNANGAEWFVSHLPEELDFPREFWYNASEAMLYFVSGTSTIDCHNDPNCKTTRTQQDPASSQFEVAMLKTLFRLQGTQAAPVERVTFTGLTFTGAAETFLDPHGVPR